MLTSNLPKANSEGDKALRAVGVDQVFDAIEMFDPAGVARLREYARATRSCRSPASGPRPTSPPSRRRSAAPRTDNVAHAVVHTEPPSIFLADDIDVLHRVLALEVVARTDPAMLGANAGSICDACSRNGGAMPSSWIQALGTGIDVYDGKSIYTADDLPADLIGAQLQFTRLFGGGRIGELRRLG